MFNVNYSFYRSLNATVNCLLALEYSTLSSPIAFAHKGLFWPFQSKDGNSRVFLAFDDDRVKPRRPHLGLQFRQL
jgi:hypothetical protein